MKNWILITLSLSALADPPARSTKIPAVQVLNLSQRKVMVQEMATWLKNMKLPSLVAAATLGNRVIWSEGIGYADYARKIKVNKNFHMYRWASVSKVATDRMIKGYDEKGILDIDKPISNYYPHAQLSYLKRCLNSSNLNKYFQCQKKYGVGPLTNIRGTCFEAKTFKKFETSKGYNSWISDKTKKSGDIVYKNKEGKTRCRIKYGIKVEKLSNRDPVITLKNLLEHKSGIQHYSHLGRSSTPPKALTKNRSKIAARKNAKASQMAWAVPYFFPKHPLLSRPGKTRTYTTFGYNLAGRILERRAGKRYEDILKRYSNSLGASSIQADYLGISSQGNYSRTFVYKRSLGKFIKNNYTTDNSYKLAGGGVMSTIVDLARFCVGVGKDGVFTRKGAKSYAHSGAHSKQSLSRLSLSTNKDGKRQCLVLMTNTNHDKVDLEKVRSKLSAKLKSLGVWK